MEPSRGRKRIIAQIIANEAVLVDNISGRYCIDFELCTNCGACIQVCRTVVADRFVHSKGSFSQSEQAQWIQYPAMSTLLQSYTGMIRFL